MAGYSLRKYRTALPSVLAGSDGRTSSRQLIEHNLLSSVNLLELAKRCRAGFILLSTSRVYSIPELAAELDAAGEAEVAAVLDEQPGNPAEGLGRRDEPLILLDAVALDD